MTVATGSVLRATARFNAGGYGDMMNVYSFRTIFATAQLEADVFDEVDIYLTSVYTEFSQLMALTLNPADLKVDVIAFQAGEWVVTQNVGFGSWGVGVVTAETNDALPPGSAAVVKLRTALGKHWGRKWVGWFTELSNDQGFPSTTLISALVTGFVRLLTPSLISAGNTIETVVLDQATGAIRQVTEIATLSQWGYQRRRRPGVGS